MNADFTLPDIEKVPAEGKILIICSPNNPTGISVSNDYIIKICEKFQGLVIVDEAYADFSLISAMPLISRFNNLIVLRTVSKSFSLASIRLGFSQSSVEIANYMNSIRLPINISYPSQLAGILAIKHLDAFEKQMEIIINERRRVSEALKEIGLEIIESESNFVLISFGTEEKAKLAFQKLKDKKILLRHYKQPGAEPYLRMTIGKPEQNDIVIKAISEIAKNL